MTKKIFSALLFLMVIVGGATFKTASADVAGCSTTYGYSATSGLACSGTGVVNPYPQSSTPVSSQFMAGCTSGLGYSITTGMACSGTGTATVGFLAGCTTALGYSTTTGAPCSGTTVAINYLAGCTAISGYSTISGAPCNGTTIATPVVVLPPTTDPTTPGLPMTGAGGNMPFNTLALIISASATILGVVYLTRKARTA